PLSPSSRWDERRSPRIKRHPNRASLATRATCPERTPPDGLSAALGRDRAFDEGAGEEIGVRARPERDRIPEREGTEVGEVEMAILDELPGLAHDPCEIGHVPVADVAREQRGELRSGRVPGPVERESSHRIV